MKIFPPEKKTKNISRDYNRFHPGWSPNSAYNSGYSFTDINIGEFYTQSMAILNINQGLLSHFEAIVEFTPWQRAQGGGPSLIAGLGQ